MEFTAVKLTLYTPMEISIAFFAQLAGGFLREVKQSTCMCHQVLVLSCIMIHLARTKSKDSEIIIILLFLITAIKLCLSNHSYIFSTIRIRFFITLFLGLCLLRTYLSLFSLCLILKASSFQFTFVTYFCDKIRTSPQHHDLNRQCLSLSTEHSRFLTTP